MRSSSLPLLLGCAFALALPSVASAQDYSPFRQPAQYDSLPIQDTDPVNEPVVVLPVSGDTAALRVTLPFPFVFMSQVFYDVNISTNGYFTFGTGPNATATSGSNTAIPTAGTPDGFVAPFWDDLNCPAGSIKTQTYGPTGSRTFVIEWDGCYRWNTPAGAVQTQVRLTEQSIVIKVFYGAAPTAGSWNFTAGIEKWDGSIGHYAPLNNPCTTSCAAADWPAHTMIQYGRPGPADLSEGAAGLQITGLQKGATQITADLAIDVTNEGRTDASGVTWDYYLSVDNRVDPTDLLLNCRHAPLETVPSARNAVHNLVGTDTCTFDLPTAGSYRICTVVDPDNTVLEASEANNTFCSAEFVLGSDLIGEVVIETEGGLGSDTDVFIRVENRGSDPTGQFEYQVIWKDCGSSGLMLPTVAHSGTLTLAGGEFVEQIVPVYLDPGLAAETLCAELIIDGADVIDELVETNNTATTCVEPDQICMALTRPDLNINALTVDMPHGCFYGDVVTLNLEICNLGATTARNFGAVFNLDENSIPTLSDTVVTAVPQACSNHDPVTGAPFDDDSLCQDIGGGQPVCLNGICHAPCTGNSNADCGNTGLECAEDPEWLVNGVRQTSCQLALPGGECKWVSATTNIPVFNTRAQTDFVDGRYFFGAIVDWTTKIGEDDENNNKKYSGESYQCWTRKPDFEPTSVRSVDVVGAGEEFPVYRRVHNNGVVGSVFSYRYVLTRNPNPSEWDVALDIVGHGPIADGTVDAFSDSDAYDTIRIPAGLVPGDYYLGILVDPANTVDELFEDNNTMVWCDKQPDLTCLPHVIRVADSSLRIVTPGLQDATVGQSYNVQLLAAGGDGSFSWSVTDGALPPGLALDPSGLLHGTVLEQGDYLFRVTVTSGAVSAMGTFVIRALPARGPLMITTDRLPPAYVSVLYTAELGASGGAPPYAWSCAGLPAWIELTNNVLVGTPSTAANAVPVVCTVTDANGQSLTATYPLAVHGADDLRITTPRMECSAGAGEACTAEVVATGGTGSYTWDFEDTAIPTGLREVTDEANGVLEGAPVVCGTFMIRVTVTDNGSLDTDSREIPLVIACDPPRLTTRNLPVAERGEAYGPVQIEAEGAVRFALVLGALPKGLVLSADGVISGTVAIDANPGDYNVAIELTDAAGGKTLGALTIVVEGVAKTQVTLTDEVTKSGCSTTGEGSAAGFLPFAALFALLGFRRASARRSAGVALVAAAALLLPAAASAQSALGYGAFTRSVVYQQLVGGTAALSGTNMDDSASAPIDLPFTFTYYGEEYTRIWVNSNGNLLLSALSTDYTNDDIPASGTPNNFIAPWWDDSGVTNGGDVRYLARGTAPNREFVVEWLANPRTYTNVPYEMQVSLYEDGTFAMRWGSPGDGVTGSATVGIEDATASARSMKYLACTPGCGQADWENSLQNREVIFATFANLRVAATTTEPEANAGIEQYFGVTVVNDGPKAVPSTTVRLVISADQVMSEDDFLVGVIPNVAVPGLATVNTGITLAVPRALDPGLYYLLAVVDPDDTVDEFVENDNEGGSFRFRVIEPAPDLAIEYVGAPTSGVPGSKVAVDLTVANRGNLDATGVVYRVVLSDNAAISSTDLLLHEGTIDVGWMETTERTELIEIPADTPAGLYYLGAVIDPENELVEFDELNNLRASAREFRVTTNGLRVDTRIPAELQVGAPFCIPLEAEGGDGVYTWSVLEGQLPPGLALNPGGAADPYGASLCGEPTAVGLFEFTLVVESGGMTAETQLSITVVTVPLQLTVASRVLPIASFNQAFEAGLSANGGRPPYGWDLVAGSLPVGLTLDGDGLIYGMPLEDGSFSLQVRVTDSVGATAVESIRLQVASPGRVTCSTESLGTVKLGEELTGRLLAGGGRQPYTWTSEDFQRLGDAGGELEDLGIELGSLGELSGKPEEVGRFVWNVVVTDDTGFASDECPISLEVVADEGLTVTTTALPLALADRDFRVQLQATGGAGALTWKALSPRPPNGLVLSEAGVLSGKLTSSDLQGQTSRTFSFLVEVRDQANKRGIGAMSVTLTTEQELGEATKVVKTTETGCSASAGGFSLVALGLVVLGLRRRR